MIHFHLIRIPLAHHIVAWLDSNLKRITPEFMKHRCESEIAKKACSTKKDGSFWLKTCKECIWNIKCRHVYIQDEKDVPQSEWLEPNICRREAPRWKRKNVKKIPGGFIKKFWILLCKKTFYTSVSLFQMWKNIFT